jgi:hypothetical protein
MMLRDWLKAHGKSVDQYGYYHVELCDVIEPWMVGHHLDVDHRSEETLICIPIDFEVDPETGVPL